VTRKSNLHVITPFTAIAGGFFKEGSIVKDQISKLYNDQDGDFSVANYMGSSLAQDMAEKYKLTFTRESNRNIEDYGVDDVVSNFPKSDYVIDNVALNWRVMYYKLKFGKYYVVLTTKMRLIDLKNKKVVSEGYCQKETEYDESRPLTYDLLFNNGAKGLIEETRKLADTCLVQYKQLLQL